MAKSTAITYTFEDGPGRTASTRVNVPADLSAADARLVAGDIGGILRSMTTGRLISASITFDATENVNPGNANAPAQQDSDVQEKGMFIFTTDGGFKTRVNVPTFDEQFTVNGGPFIDTDATEIEDFVDRMTTLILISDIPGLTTGLEMVDQREDPISSLETAYENFTNRGRPRT